MAWASFGSTGKRISNDYEKKKTTKNSFEGIEGDFIQNNLKTALKHFKKYSFYINVEAFEISIRGLITFKA